ncbi:TIGR02281 family clan AA aspartic protease [Agrobacterium vitis]|uniref:TIGR02281 family clan AA aspartic protease n=1 Tax=Agrobacterium vitis TaxID=373 RepID=UPI0012E7AE87|nr:TIGR02281 family clan AA aspartic protease [Agrobacterium vitis]MCF1452018.1 TIGR02281 family clan AA aspartic protease [Agrobacterium vitis]MVA81110.1 TIGR02281 family clan AA aspartic protease [Agrobacterium vitis]BCH52954.1 aspartyl protease [Agrobacterium vitis]
MFMRVVVFAGLTVLVATQLPAYLQDRTDTVPEKPSQAASLEATRLAVAPQSVAGSGQAILKADGRGHFIAPFRINGKTVDAMIDTGASTVAINETTARRLGFGGNDLNFKYKVNTANGDTLASVVMLDRVEVGGVCVTQVQALVLKDKALSGTLIGMTFLKQLGSYKVEDGQLKLSQK